jgi:ribonuclease HII
MKPKRIIIGIDEVGRGALAGPVVASAIAIEHLIDGVKDSKLLNVKQREKLAGEIEKHALALSIEMIPPQEIDKLNIYNATLLAMKNALFMTLEDLKPSYDTEVFVFIDGDAIFQITPEERINLPTTRLHLIALPRADKFIYQVSCASIYAKHNRDVLMMTIFDAKYPVYNFKRNLGYPTPEHIRAIKDFGPCEIHRKTFLKNFDEMMKLPL